jgi:hypothetical protein
MSLRSHGAALPAQGENHENDDHDDDDRSDADVHGVRPLSVPAPPDGAG